MQRYNKAYQAGAGAVAAYLIVLALEAGGVSVSQEVGGALAVILSGLGPVVGPANK